MDMHQPIPGMFLNSCEKLMISSLLHNLQWTSLKYLTGPISSAVRDWVLDVVKFGDNDDGANDDGDDNEKEANNDNESQAPAWARSLHCGRELRGGDLAIRSSNPFLRRKMVKNGDAIYRPN